MDRAVLMEAIFDRRMFCRQALRCARGAHRMLAYIEEVEIAVRAAPDDASLARIGSKHFTSQDGRVFLNSLPDRQEDDPYIEISEALQSGALDPERVMRLVQARRGYPESSGEPAPRSGPGEPGFINCPYEVRAFPSGRAIKTGLVFFYSMKPVSFQKLFFGVNRLRVENDDVRFVLTAFLQSSPWASHEVVFPFPAGSLDRDLTVFLGRPSCSESS